MGVCLIRSYRLFSRDNRPLSAHFLGAIGTNFDKSGFRRGPFPVNNARNYEKIFKSVKFENDFHCFDS